MNVEHIPAEDVDVLPSGVDWQSRHLESERRKAEIRDRIHKQAEQGQKTAKDYFRPAKPTPSIYDSDLKRVAVYARVSTSSEERLCGYPSELERHQCRKHPQPLPECLSAGRSGRTERYDGNEVWKEAGYGIVI